MQEESHDKHGDHYFGVTLDEYKNRVVVHIKGIIGSTPSTTRLVMKLSELSKDYPTCIVHLNSPGGSVHHAVEILAELKKFKNLITVATGFAASAGFVLWAIGDIRVVGEYTGLMAHRERYSLTGVTRHHKQTADFAEELYGKLMYDTCTPFLTEKEIERMEYEDINITGEEMINRGLAISAEDFHKMDSSEACGDEIAVINGKMFIRDHTADTATEVTDIALGKVYDSFLLKYGIYATIDNEDNQTKEENDESDSTTERQSETEQCDK